MISLTVAEAVYIRETVMRAYISSVDMIVMPSASACCLPSASMHTGCPACSDMPLIKYTCSYHITAVSKQLKCVQLLYNHVEHYAVLVIAAFQDTRQAVSCCYRVYSCVVQQDCMQQLCRVLLHCELTSIDSFIAPPALLPTAAAASSMCNNRPCCQHLTSQS
jgi:hypothetical protein